MWIIPCHSAAEHEWKSINMFSGSSINDFPGGSDGKASACNAGDLGSIPGSGRSPGEGNGNPLQYYCLENPMDRGAWQAAVYGVAKSQTRLSDFPSQSHCINYESHFTGKETAQYWTRRAPLSQSFSRTWIKLQVLIFFLALPPSLPCQTLYSLTRYRLSTSHKPDAIEANTADRSPPYRSLHFIKTKLSCLGPALPDFHSKNPFSFQ